MQRRKIYEEKITESMNERVKEIHDQSKQRCRQESSREVDIKHQDQQPEKQTLERQKGHKTHDGTKSKPTSDLTRSLAGAKDLEKILYDLEPNMGPMSL